MNEPVGPGSGLYGRRLADWPRPSLATLSLSFLPSKGLCEGLHFSFQFRIKFAHQGRVTGIALPPASRIFPLHLLIRVLRAAGEDTTTRQ